MNLFRFLRRTPKRHLRGDWTDVYLADDHPALRLPDPPPDWTPNALTRQTLMGHDWGCCPPTRAMLYQTEQQMEPLVRRIQEHA